MRPPRAGAIVSADWPPVVRQVLLSAAHECPRGHARALAELASLALRKVPARGLFDPAIRGEHDLFTAIEAVAIKHLGRRAARTRWRQSLDAPRLPFEARDDIESAAQQMQAISDTAYFYAGLAFGLVYVCSCRTP
jgi:hypothetical protein